MDAYDAGKLDVVKDRSARIEKGKKAGQAWGGAVHDTKSVGSDGQKLSTQPTLASANRSEGYLNSKYLGKFIIRSSSNEKDSVQGQSLPHASQPESQPSQPSGPREVGPQGDAHLRAFAAKLEPKKKSEPASPLKEAAVKEHETTESIARSNSKAPAKDQPPLDELVKGQFHNIEIVSTPLGLASFNSFHFNPVAADLAPGHPLPPCAPTHKIYVKRLTKTLHTFGQYPLLFRDLVLCRREKFDERTAKVQTQIQAQAQLQAAHHRQKSQVTHGHGREVVS